MNFKDVAVATHVTPYHTDPELSYCYGCDAITLEYGWFCYVDTPMGRVATTPLFDDWCRLLFYIGQEGYTFSREKERTFVKREAIQQE